MLAVLVGFKQLRMFMLQRTRLSHPIHFYAIQDAWVAGPVFSGLTFGHAVRGKKKKKKK
jgi:hypothetical protein